MRFAEPDEVGPVYLPWVLQFEESFGIFPVVLAYIASAVCCSGILNPARKVRDGLIWSRTVPTAGAENLETWQNPFPVPETIVRAGICPVLYGMVPRDHFRTIWSFGGDVLFLFTGRSGLEVSWQRTTEVEVAAAEVRC